MSANKKRLKERARRRKSIMEIYRTAPERGMVAAIKAANSLRVSETLTAVQAPGAVPAGPPPVMGAEDMDTLAGAWFDAQARTGHESPFWQVPAA